MKSTKKNNTVSKLIIRNLISYAFFIVLLIIILEFLLKNYTSLNIKAKSYKKTFDIKKINQTRRYQTNSCSSIVDTIKFQELPPSENNGKQTISKIPNKIVLHWSEDPNFNGNTTTYNGLKNRKRACAYAVDDKGILQMVKIDFNNKTRTLEQCVGGNIDYSSISIEISGTEFDLFIDPDTLNLATPSSNLEKLKKIYDRYRRNYYGLKSNIKKYKWDEKKEIFYNSTNNLICLINFLFEKYNLNEKSLKGHYELYDGKSDPGFLYISFVKKLLNLRK